MFCRDIPVSSSTCFVFKPAPPLHLYYLACALKKETMIFLLASRRGNTLSEYGDILRYITGIQSSVFRDFQKKPQQFSHQAALPAVWLSPCSSIPLRSISLTGCSSCRPALAMQLDSAPLHLAHGLRPMQEEKKRTSFVRAR